MRLFEKRPAEISELIGKTFREVVGVPGGKSLVFIMEGGGGFVFAHVQDCCESVDIEDIAGDLSDLEGLPLAFAEKIESTGHPPKDATWDELYEWTFYKFRTAKGYVTVRWYGASNGYYSVGVDLFYYALAAQGVS